MTATRPSRTSSPDRLESSSLSSFWLARVIVEDAGQGRAEAGQMAAAVDGVDGVGEAKCRLGEAVVVLERGFDGRAVGLLVDVDRPRLEDDALAVEVADEALNAAFEVERELAVVALVEDADPDAFNQVGALAQSLRERHEIVVELSEDLGIGQEGDSRAIDGGGHHPSRLPRGATARLRFLADVAQGDAAFVLLDVGLAAAAHFGPHLLRQGVDDGRADAVEAAGDLVDLSAELAAGVQEGHDRLQGGFAGLLVDVDRDAAAVIPDGDVAVGVEDDFDVVAEAGHAFVDGVVGDSRRPGGGGRAGRCCRCTCRGAGARLRGRRGPGYRGRCIGLAHATMRARSCRPGAVVCLLLSLFPGFCPSLPRVRAAGARGRGDDAADRTAPAFEDGSCDSFQLPNCITVEA